MAYAKGTDAAGGGSTVNQAWVNKVAEEKWAAEQEEKRRRERVEDRAAQERAHNDANAQKQEQLAAKKRAEEQAAQQAAAQKAEQERAAREAAIQAARQRAQEQQEAAARAAAERQRQAEEKAAREAAERAQREAAAREAEALRQEQLAARRAEQERIAREKAAAQAAAEQAAALAAAAKREEDRKSDASGLSYTGSGASPKTQEREAEWFAPKTETPAAAVPAATATTTAEATAVQEDQWRETPESVAEVKVSQPRYRTVAKRTEEPVVYTEGSSTGVGNKTVRRMAANTKAALTEAESGMSPKQLAWLQSPAGQAALANQQAKQANDATLKGAKRYFNRNGREYFVDEAEGLVEERNGIQYPRATAGTTTANNGAGIVYGGAAQPAAGSGATRDTGLPNPQVIDRNAQPGTTTPQTTGGVTTPTIGEVMQEIANDWLLSRNGNTNPGNEVVNNYRVGTPGGQRYDARYPRTNISNEEMDYILDQNTGPALSETPSFGEVLGEMWGNRGPDRSGTGAELTYGSYTPPSKSYEGDGQIINPNVGRNSTGEWKALQQEDKWIQEGYAEAQKQPGWTERDRRDYAMYYAQQKAAEQPASTEPTWQEKLAKRREEAAQNNNRPGAANALDEIMNGSQPEAGYSFEGNKAAEDYLAAWQRRQAEIDKSKAAGTETTTGTTGSTTNEKSGSGTSTSKKGTSGYERAEKNAPKGSVYFKPSYGQGGQGVKLPYGKYTENDLKDVGNVAYGTKNGVKQYEGYYYWNGSYYPVDQEKAAYYKQNGNSYDGWTEDKREYYKTFGTYYGYRTDWRTAGGKNTWKANQPAKSSGSGGTFGSTSSSTSKATTSTPASAGRSYGRGSTANNGLYWNGNTSWSI